MECDRKENTVNRVVDLAPSSENIANGPNEHRQDSSNDEVPTYVYNKESKIQIF